MPTVLICDDEPTICRFVRETVDRDDVVVHVAGTVAAARAIIEADGEIDLAIIDKELPDGNGLQLVAHLRAKHGDAEAIVMTGFASVESAVDAIRCGVFDYVTKPFDASRLVISVKNGLDKVALKKDQRRLQSQLAHEVQHDSLTGLPNQVYFRRRLARVVRGQRRGDRYAAVLFLDLDRFKAVNDSLGHAAGDRLLVAVARQLELSLRSIDVCARLGGDEFAILLEDLRDPSEAEQVAARLAATLEVPILIDGHEIFATASIGIAHCGELSADEVVRAADTAMYHAKSSGKARSAVFEPTMHEEPRRFLSLDGQLRRAIDRDELKIAYQPIRALATGKTAGFEALLRWNSPVHGQVPPGEFIRVAEETGQIAALGRWVLAESAKQLAAWRAAYPAAQRLFMCVNVSRRQLLPPGDLSAAMAAVLAETGLPAEALELELTETAVGENLSIAGRELCALHELGVRLSLDDFGTGWSSLAVLHELPFDTLKIDRSFIGRLERRGFWRKTDIVQTILDLARTLGMSVVAEGIESEEQHAELRRRKCEYGQGFLLGRPGSAEDAARLVSDGGLALPIAPAVPAIAGEVAAG